MIEYPNMKPSELAEAMGAEFLKLMEAHFPMLCQLERQVSDPHSDSDNPAVAMLGDHGAAWGQLLPKGVQNGQCLVWAQGDGGGRWEAGEGGGGGPNNMAWAATLATNGDGDPVVSHLGGTVTFFGGAGTTFETAEYEIEESGGEWQDAYCYLFWDASHNSGAGRWTREVEDAYPTEADMDDGDVFIPLWSLVDGVLTQETVGAIVIPAIKNYVDADTSGENGQSSAAPGNE